MVTTSTTSELPRWVRRYLAPESAGLVGQALREAETATHAVIVPLVVRRSTVTGHVFPLLAALLLALVFALDLTLDLGGWLGAASAGGLALGLLRLVVVIGLAWGLSQLSLLRRLLTAHHDLEVQVLRRAALEFYEAGLDRVADGQQGWGAGVLLFVSVAERRAVVLADRETAARLHPETWQDVVALLVQGVRRADLGHGLVDAIAACRRHLEGHVPAHGERPTAPVDALLLKE